jgi:hypothetical protein
MKKVIALAALLFAVASVGTVFARDVGMIDVKTDKKPVSQNLSIAVSKPKSTVTVLRCVAPDKGNGLEISWKSSAELKTRKVPKKDLKNPKAEVETSWVFRGVVFYDDRDPFKFTNTVKTAINANTNYTFTVAAKDAAKIRGIGIEFIEMDPTMQQSWFDDLMKKWTKKWVDDNFGSFEDAKNMLR